MAADGNLLSTEELGALTAGIDDGSIEVDTGINTGAQVVRHDIASEDSSLGVNTGAIDMINERFVRHFRSGLVDILRTTPKMSQGEVSTLPFSEYLNPLEAPLSVNIVRLNPMRGYSLMVIDPNLIFACLDNFFGGFGRGIGELPQGRLFTPTENSIINLLVDIMFASLQEAWAPVMPMSCERVSTEVNPQFAQIADEMDLVVWSQFKMSIGDTVEGSVDIVYPYGALKPIRDLLRSRVQTGDDDDASASEWSQQLRTASGDAKLDINVTLANINASIGEMERWKDGDVLYFANPDHATVRVAGTPIFSADVGTSGPQAAVKIAEGISPPKN